MNQHEKQEPISSEKLYEFRKLMKQVKGYRGSGTQMISVYIPAGYPLHETSNKIKEELGQASNIKSKQTRTNVMDLYMLVVGSVN